MRACLREHERVQDEGTRRGWLKMRVDLLRCTPGVDLALSSTTAAFDFQAGPWQSRSLGGAGMPLDLPGRQPCLVQPLALPLVRCASSTLLSADTNAGTCLSF